MLEYHNAVMKNSSIQRFKWFLYAHFPFPSHIYLLCALRDRTSDEFADKAWHELSESADLRMKDADSPFFNKMKRSFIHLALGNMTIKAWEAREAAFQNSPQALPVPRFVSQYRNLLAEKRSGKHSETSDSSPSTLVDQPFEGQMASKFSILDPSAPGLDQASDQSMLPGMHPWSIESRLFQYPNPPTNPPTGWEFWNDMVQAGDQMQGIYAIPPPYNYYQN